MYIHICHLFATELTQRLQEDPDPNLFATEVRNCAGTSVTFEIWSAKVRMDSTFYYN
jgi:hypothetical protein